MDGTEGKNAKFDIDSKTYRHLIILILQFLAEENYEESLHLLEQESKIYFNLKYFGDKIVNGEWEKAENYLSAFTGTVDSLLSRKIFFEIQKHRYYEAKFSRDQAEAAAILQKDFSMFSASLDEKYGEFDKFLSSECTREDQNLSRYVNTEYARANLQSDLKELIEENPSFRDKLVFPKLNNSGLLSIMYLIYPSPGKETSIKEELIYLILQFLDEESFTGTLHKLEQETKLFFNLNYFGKFVIDGEWDKAANYLSAFTKLNDRHLLQRTFKLKSGRKRGSLSHLSRRKRGSLPHYMDASSVRPGLIDGLNQLIGKYPVLQDKLKFPHIDKSRLLTIIKQTMDWWVPHCTKASANNWTVSLGDIPQVPYLCYDPAVHISSSILKTQESVRENMSNQLDCAIPIMKITEEFGLQGIANCGSQKAMENGSGCLMDVNCGAGIKLSGKITKINDPSQCCLLVLPDDPLVARDQVARLMYSCSGDFILALTQNARHKLWLLHDDKCSSGKAITDIQPRLNQPSSGQVMINDVGSDPENSIPCFALKDHHLLSASGGRISLYNLKDYEIEKSFATPPPVATYFIFLPQDIIAIGFEDSTILIYSKTTKARLEGHQKTITCLAFSHNLNVLVSSGADAQLCVWDVAGWKKLANTSLRSFDTGQVPDPAVVNHIEFHKDQIHFLSFIERQIDIYEAPMLNHLMQYAPRESDLPMTYATYSCDGQSIFVSFKSGCIKVVASETLDIRCMINLTAYAQPIPRSLEVYPTVMAAHPLIPNQIALGLTDARVIVLEPLASEGGWGTLSQ